MALKPPPISEVISQVNDLVGSSGLRGEVDKGMKALVQSGLGRLDVVSREEFDAQTDILRRTRARVEELEAQIAALTAAIDAAESGEAGNTD